MAEDENEEQLLRSVALQNANSILLARQRAERELVEAKDALERKTKDLAQSLAMTRATLEATSNGILATDARGEVTGFNQNFVNMWRLPAELMARRDHRKIIEFTARELRDPEKFRAKIEEIYAASPPETFDVLELADGRVFERFTRIQFLEDRNVGRVWSFRDITARKHAEAALRESEKMHRVFFELGSVGMAYVSPSGRFLKVNEKFCEVTGYSPEELAQLTPLALTHPDDRQKEREQAGRYIRENLPVHKSERRYIRKDGSVRWVSVAARMIHEPDGAPRYSIGIVEDITERRKAEAELQETDRRKDEFLAILAHELRNPLAPIRNGLQVLTLAGNNLAMAEKARSMMDQALNQLVRLVDDLLDASRITTGKLQLRRERVELAAVVQSAIETSRPLIDERAHKLHVTLPPVPILLEADATRLAQVFSNLLNNAAKYSEPRGRIGVCAEAQEETVLVRVTDSGIGIAADHLPRIFEMFAQLDTASERSQGGLGIGLSLVKALVEMHGGTIEARSAGIGRGSEFVVHLPRAGSQPRTQIRGIGRDGTPALSSPKHRILIVDDNRLSSDSAAIALRLMGHEVITAYDGIEAMEVARMFRPNVVLLDIGLPKLNGYETARRMRDQSWGKDIFLIAVTGYGQEADRRRSIDAGFNYHMVKPVNFPELENKLSELPAL